jgi:N-acetylated-alpha-linked acidic dipeptidase
VLKTRAHIWLARSVVSAAIVFLLTAHADQPGTPMFGYSVASATVEQDVELRLQRAIAASRIATDHQFLTSMPHPAGSARDRALAIWTADQWRAAGLEDVRITEQQIHLPRTSEVTVELKSPRAVRAAMDEAAADGDEDMSADGTEPPHLAYSAAGDVTGSIVYAGQGLASEYDWLASHHVNVHNAIVIVREAPPYIDVAFKTLAAERHGAAGLLVFSDPGDDGPARGEVYPKGPWAPATAIHQGTVAYDFLEPGDPLATYARHVEATGARSLPHIVTVPISSADARSMLTAIGGPAAPRNWPRGSFAYRVGPGPARAHVRVGRSDHLSPIWTVTGQIAGAVEPNRWVVLGNHRDAVLFGGTDPSTGSASLMEVARAFGAMARRGIRPKRTVILASWDGGELARTSSTLWGEQHQDLLSRRAVAYLNVQTAASGATFAARTVPALNRVVEQVTGVVADPATGMFLPEAFRRRTAGDGGASPFGIVNGFLSNRFGGTSDSLVFLNFLGIPTVDMTFYGPTGVVRTRYDTHRFVSMVADPGFRYTATMAQLWAVLAARIANADLLPFDYRSFASHVEEYLTELERAWRASGHAGATHLDLVRSREATRRLADTAERFTTRALVALDHGAGADLQLTNDALLRAERALIDPQGLHDRPWFKHQIYAPNADSEPTVLPGLADAVASGDETAVDREDARMAAALTRVASVLHTHPSVSD